MTAVSSDVTLYVDELPHLELGGGRTYEQDGWQKARRAGRLEMSVRQEREGRDEQLALRTVERRATEAAI